MCECVVFQLFIFKHIVFLPFVFRSYHAILLSIHLAVKYIHRVENKMREVNYAITSLRDGGNTNQNREIKM